MRILALSQGTPFPPIGGGLLRTFHLLKALAHNGHAVTLASFTYDSDVLDLTLPIRVATVAWQWPPLYRQMREGDGEASVRAHQELSRPDAEPWFASCAESPAMDDMLARLSREPFDLVLVEGSAMARFIRKLPAHAMKVLDLLDVHSNVERIPRSDVQPGDAERAFKFEQRAVSQSDLCLTVSERDAEAVKTLFGGAHVCVVPNGVDCQFFTPQPSSLMRPGTVLFTGKMNYPPNVEAVHYFVEQVWPLVRAPASAATFHIAGADPTDQVRALAAEDVVVHGGVDDMRPFYGAAEVVVVPLLRGGGTRLKILEAAACAKSIVTTSLGVEGLDFTHDRDVLIADSPTDFAGAVNGVLIDRQRRIALGAAARTTAERYDWEGIGTRFCATLEALTSQRTKS